MIEVGTEYKIAIDPNKQNKAAYVRFIDMKRAGLGIVHLLNADWPLATKIESIWSIIRHVIFKTVHTGFASQAVAWGEALPEKGFPRNRSSPPAVHARICRSNFGRRCHCSVKDRQDSQRNPEVARRSEKQSSPQGRQAFDLFHAANSKYPAARLPESDL